MSAVAINFATLDQLQTIPGVKEKLARAILSVRVNSGNITRDVLLTLTRGKIPCNVIDNIDFTFDEALFKDRSNPKVSKPAPTISIDLGEPAVSDVSGIAPIPDMRTIERQRRHTMDVMKALPKGLIFDGKSNWFAFKRKFSLYAPQLAWTSEDCFNCLCWGLTGKAADFYAILLEQKHSLNYRQLLNKLDPRAPSHGPGIIPASNPGPQRDSGGQG